MDIDPVRQARQMQVVRRWGKNGCRGTLEAATGFGKTWTAKLGIENLFTKYPEKNPPAYMSPVIVVVPSKHLKDSWEKDAKEWGMDDLIDVWIVNSYINIKKRPTCRLLILDEIHKYTGEEHRKAITRTKYKRILGLTATLPEDDDRRKIITKRAPVIDTVPLEECIRNEWVVPFTIFNIPVQLTEEEKKLYQKYHKQFEKPFGYFNHNLGDVFKALRDDSFAEKMADMLDISSGQVKGMASNVTRGMQGRKDVVYGAKGKIKMAGKIARYFSDSKIIYFSERIEAANRVVEEIGRDTARAYHSKVEGREVDGEYYGRKRMRDRNLQLFESNAIRCISATQSLDEGMNIAEIEIGAILSGSSKLLQALQRLGRTIRKKAEIATAKIIEVYIPGTQDETWLRKRQRSIPHERVKFVESLEEIS